MKRAVCLLLAWLLILSLASCGEKEEESINLTDYKIVTSFYPVYITVMNIAAGAENVAIMNLIDEEIGCIHDYMLTGKDLKKMTGADLFIASGMGMETFVGMSSLGIPGLEVLDCSEDIKHVIANERGKENPHYWMNIENTIEQCEKIKRALCLFDPSNSAIYEANAASYTERLRALEAEVKPRIEKLKDKTIVVYHDSFDYFAEEFGLEIITINDAEEAAKYENEISNLGYMFAQKSVADSKEYQSFAKKTRCTTYIIDTLTCPTEGEVAEDAYINAIRRNLDMFEHMSEQ